MYMMPEGCPLVTSTGESVIRDGKCFVWHPHMHVKNGIPHPFVADAEAVKIQVTGDCQVASRVTHNVPYFRHVVKLKPGMPGGEEEPPSPTDEPLSPTEEPEPSVHEAEEPEPGLLEVEEPGPTEEAPENCNLDGEIGDGQDEQKTLDSD